MFRKTLLAMALSVCVATAFALPRPSDVRAAVNAGDYSRAEVMLIEVIREKPSARAHYDLGQVYAFEGKHSLAVGEYQRAQAMDPTLKFASSSAEFNKRLAKEQSLIAPPPQRVQARAQAPEPFPTMQMPAVPQPTATVVQHDSGNAGSVLLAMLGFGVLGAGGYFLYSSISKSKEKANKKADEVKKTERLLAASKKLEDAELIAKTATYSDQVRAKVIARIAELQNSTRSYIASIKDGEEVSESRITSLEQQVIRVVDQANNGISEPAIAAEPITETDPVRQEEPEWATAESVARQARARKPSARARNNWVPPVPTPPAPAPRVVHHHYTTPTPAPAPVVVNNGNDLLTGILIGEAMNHHSHERTVYVEREPAPRYEREDRYDEPAPVMDTPRYERDSYDAPATSDSTSRDNDSY